MFHQTGGLGKIHIPLLSDLNKQISRDYGVLLEGPGIALRWVYMLFLMAAIMTNVCVMIFFFCKTPFLGFYLILFHRLKVCHVFQSNACVSHQIFAACCMWLPTQFCEFFHSFSVVKIFRDSDCICCVRAALYLKFNQLECRTEFNLEFLFIFSPASTDSMLLWLLLLFYIFMQPEG